MSLAFIIRFSCDEPNCCEQNEMGHCVAPEKMPVLIENFGIKNLPPGWSIQDGKTYCQQHGTRLVKPSALSIAALGGRSH